MPQHPLNDVVRKASPRVLDLQQQLLVTIGYDRQRIVSLSYIPKAALAPRAPGCTKLRIERLILEHQNALEERPATRHFTPPLDLDQRSVLEPTHRHLLCAKSSQPRSEFELGINMRPHGQRIDEQANHIIGAAEGRFAAGAGGAENDVRLPAVTMQQQGPGSLQQSIERYGRLAPSCSQRGGKRNRQTNLI